MTNKKRELLQIRLDPETAELVSSLLARTNLTKTSLIKTALKVYAGTLKNGHIFTIRYKAEKQEPKRASYKLDHNESEEDVKSWDNLIEELDE